MLPDLEYRDVVFTELQRAANFSLGQQRIAEYRLVSGRHRTPAAIRQRHVRTAPLRRGACRISLPAGPAWRRNVPSPPGARPSRLPNWVAASSLRRVATSSSCSCSKLRPDSARMPIEPDDVIAELGLHRLADFPLLHGEQLVGELLGRRLAACPVQFATLGGGSGVFGILLCQCGKMCRRPSTLHTRLWRALTPWHRPSCIHGDQDVAGFAVFRRHVDCLVARIAFAEHCIGDPARLQPRRQGTFRRRPAARIRAAMKSSPCAL